MKSKFILAIGAFIGLLFSFLGSRSSKATVKKVSKLEGKIEDSQQRQDLAEAESIKATQDAKESNKKAVEAAESITAPDYDLSGGYTKHTSSSD